MIRLMTTLALLIGLTFGLSGVASAEVFRPDLGMGLTDYLSKMANPAPGTPSQIAPTPLLDIPPPNGRMAISPTMLQATSEQAALSRRIVSARSSSDQTRLEGWLHAEGSSPRPLLPSLSRNARPLALFVNHNREHIVGCVCRITVAVV